MNSASARIAAASAVAVFSALSAAGLRVADAQGQAEPQFNGYAYVQQRTARGDIVARYPIASGKKTSKPDWIIPGAQVGQPIAVDPRGRVYMILCSPSGGCNVPLVEVFNPGKTKPARTFTVPGGGPGLKYFIYSLFADAAGRVYIGILGDPSAPHRANRPSPSVYVGQLTIFAANARGNPQPIQSINTYGPPSAMALGPTGDLVANSWGTTIQTFSTPLKNPRLIRSITLPVGQYGGFRNEGLAVARNGDIYVGVFGGILEYSAGASGLVPPNRVWFPSAYDGNAIGLMNGILFFARDFPHGSTVGALVGGEMNEVLPDALTEQPGTFGNVLVGPGR